MIILTGRCLTSFTSVNSPIRERVPVSIHHSYPNLDPVVPDPTWETTVEGTSSPYYQWRFLWRSGWDSQDKDSGFPGYRDWESGRGTPPRSTKRFESVSLPGTDHPPSLIAQVRWIKVDPKPDFLNLSLSLDCTWGVPPEEGRSGSVVLLVVVRGKDFVGPRHEECWWLWLTVSTEDKRSFVDTNSFEGDEPFAVENRRTIYHIWGPRIILPEDYLNNTNKLERFTLESLSGSPPTTFEQKEFNSFWLLIWLKNLPQTGQKSEFEGRRKSVY